MEEAAVDEAHEINAVAEELGLDPLEVRSEEEENAALRRLRRANDAADAI
jgi:2-hydroxychromene-2-carboxylate isomerase